MLAWKQPFIQRVRNSSLVEGLRVDNNRVSEAMGCITASVGEHSAGVECGARAPLERAEKQM